MLEGDLRKASCMIKHIHIQLQAHTGSMVDFCPFVSRHIKDKLLNTPVRLNSPPDMHKYAELDAS